jgi:diacylglycerol kinase (ATP)
VAAACAEIAALPPGSRVLVAGGDGTLQRLLPTLLAGGHELALLPCGTGNDLARALGLRGAGWRVALDAALHSPASPIDLGELRADGGAPQPFASSLCAGFDAACGAAAHTAPPWLRGMPRYLLATARTLLTLRRHHLQIWLDDAAIADGEQLFASSLNTPTYASGMPVAPDARIDDGRLDLVLAGPLGRLGTLLALPLMLAGAHRRHPRIRLQPFTRLRLQAEAPLPLALDGEPVAAGRTIDVTVRPSALRVVAAQR